jgi:site-specific recombinase XerD
MKRIARPSLSVEDQQDLDYYVAALKHLEDFSTVTMRNSLSDLCHIIPWYEYCWCKGQNEQSIMPRAVVPPLLIRYRTSLQTTTSLKPSSINQALISLKRFFAWVTKTQVNLYDPTDTVNFGPKEVVILRRLNDEEESEQVAAVKVTGTLRKRTINALLLQRDIRARELCILTRKQMHQSKRKGMLTI